MELPREMSCINAANKHPLARRMAELAPGRWVSLCQVHSGQAGHLQA